MKSKIIIATIVLWLGALAPSGPVHSAGFVPIGDRAWNKIAVRKVLHVFAYGGFATDKQIKTWADMPPHDAIREMLTFSPVNDKLSPGGSAVDKHGDTLEDLQVFLSSDRADNPVCPSDRPKFAMSYIPSSGSVRIFNGGLRNVWIAAVNTRGLNPFRLRVGFWLTNYHMAVDGQGTGDGLLREHYDSAMDALEAQEPFHKVLAIGATSAAVAQRYGHATNRYLNDKNLFLGNDDFAREFHQLFFRIVGDTEDPDYHESTTIENTALALTGMAVDRDPAVPGSRVAPIDFTDHTDATGKLLLNGSNHHWGDLEILRTQISGTTAEEKLFRLAEIAIHHPESLDNLPIAIIGHFADDNITPAKARLIREEWRKLVGRRGDLLDFLRAYAISTTFRRRDTVKYRTAFDRNLTLFNLNTADAQDNFRTRYTPTQRMSLQGAIPFNPAHGVFGGQTSLEAADSANLFRLAYNAAVRNPYEVYEYWEECRSPSGEVLWTWERDWARIIPKKQGVYTVGAVGRWLWRRLISDGGGQRNFGLLERAFVAGFLAGGKDFGLIANPENPEMTITSDALSSEPLASLLRQLENETIALNSINRNERKLANIWVGEAINFISMTPFMFAVEGK